LFWKWRFGNAVLSKHPIRHAKPLPLPPLNWWESWLVGNKQGVQVVATHLDARNERNRVDSVQTILRHLNNDLIRQKVFDKRAGDTKPTGGMPITRMKYPTFLAGDLNSTPTHFPHSSNDQNHQNAINLLDSAGEFRRMPDQNPSLNDMTYPSVDPDRVINWIMIPSDWQFRGYGILPSTLSDHRRIFADVAPSDADGDHRMPNAEKSAK
jgi:endonuclease/exonuclease/phosphatase family metal-dependent hydrolase